MRRKQTRAFTLIETVAALAIASIALLGLLQLHLISIRTADKAQTTTQAVFLAQEKMAELVSSGFPPVGSRSGVAENDGLRFTWHTEVTNASIPQMGFRLDHLRKVSVEVGYGDHPSGPQVRLTTYVAEKKIRER